MRGQGKPWAIAMGCFVATSALVLPLAPAQARDDDQRVEIGGACTGGGTWKLESKLRDGGLEVEYEVDSNVVGQTWQYDVSRNGASIASGSATTTGPSGSFSIETNTSGSLSDLLAAVATLSGDGQSCDSNNSVEVPVGTPGDDNPSDDDNSDDDDSGRDDSGDNDSSDDSSNDNGGENESGGSSARVVKTDMQSCGNAELKLKAKKRNGRVEVEVEVDANRSGQLWNYKIARNGEFVRTGSGTTRGRSASFSAQRKVRNAGSVRTIKAVVQRPSTANQCSAMVHI